MTLRLTRAQVREIDRRATADYGIPSIVLMENAARGAADVAMEMLGERQPTRAKVCVVCGGGNNGGDGLAIARHLQNRGVDVWIALMRDPEKYRGDAAINWQIIRSMHFFISAANDPKLPFLIQNSQLVVDCLFGTGLESAPRDPDQINLMNESQTKVLAVDVPSGLDCDTGLPLGPCIRAARTVTFVAEKAGFANPTSRQYTGAITIVDIGVPLELIVAVAAT